MRILYLTYGSQSGVVSFLIKRFLKNGVSDVVVFNAAEKLRYSMKNCRFPSLLPWNIINTIFAVVKYKKFWKTYFLRTDFALNYMSRQAKRYVIKNYKNFDLIIQSGVLFTPFSEGKNIKIPYYLYIDHTYAITKRYTALRGIRTPRCASSRWEQVEKNVYKQADIVFTMSECVKKSLVNDYGLENEKVSVVGAGPNFDEMPDVQNRSYDGKTILFLGKNFYLKGGLVMLEAFKIVRRQISSARLIIGGTDQSKLKVYDDGVEVVGLVDFSQTKELYKRASIFVLPTYREAFGLVFLEAMAYGLPCVGTNIEAIPEIISDATTGFLVEWGDAKELADKIIFLLKNKDLAISMGQKGHEKVKNNFTWDIVADRILSKCRENTKICGS